MSPHSASSVVQLTRSDVDWITDLLGAAFAKVPPMRSLFSGSRSHIQTADFIRCACTYALYFGECYTTSGRGGVALWLPPRATSTSLMKMAPAGLLLAPLRLGLGALPGVISFLNHVENMHKAAAPMPHYYLMMLGVHPQEQGKGVSRFLLEPMLERADREQMPVYLETQSESNLDIYRRFGFDLIAEDNFPGINALRNWSMLRPATQS